MVLLTSAPFAWVGSLYIRSLPGGTGEVKLVGADWQEVWTAILPAPGALVAGALLLVPFGLSTLRLLRRH